MFLIDIPYYHTTIAEITDRPEPGDYDTTIADLNYERPDSDEITYQENENRQRGESKIMNIGYFCFSFSLRHFKVFKLFFFPSGVAIEKLINPFGSFGIFFYLKLI